MSFNSRLPAPNTFAVIDPSLTGVHRSLVGEIRYFRNYFDGKRKGFTLEAGSKDHGRDVDKFGLIVG